MFKITSIICCILIILTPAVYLGFAVGEAPAGPADSGEPLFIELKAARFDPLRSEPDISQHLTYPAETEYYLVQCRGPIQSQWARALQDSGAVILGYIPEYTYILYMDEDTKSRVDDLSFVRWTGFYQPAYKLDHELLAETGKVQLNVLVFEEFDDGANYKLVRTKITDMGGRIIRDEMEANTIVAELESGRLTELLFVPEVEWVDSYSEPVSTMDNIRVFTGATSPLHSNGFTGTDIVGEIKDSGLDEDHPEFTETLLDTDGNVEEDSHGTSTFGIVFAKGVDSRAKGMLPDGQGVFASWGVSRIQSIANLVNNWEGWFQSNSWHSGSADSSYASNSRQNDEAVFEYDVSMLYASGNGGNEGTISQEATGKNVISVGALSHYNNQDKTDDRHTGYQGNRGPTDDGRIKPDIVGPYDSIYTTTSGDRYTSGFGGTSGATPVVAGGVGLIYEMYRENHFKNNPGGTMPHASTVKAILIADAYQYEFSQGNRFAQGWGLVDVANVYNIGKNHLIDDENNILQTGQKVSYKITPTTLTPLKISLVWTDVPGTTSSSKHLINNLNLRVLDPNGVEYHGNNGLESSKWSSSGGDADDKNNVECVFIEEPTQGEWTIEVSAKNIAMDAESGTSEVDQRFALVASGVTKYEHDLSVGALSFPEFVGTGETVPVQATLMNMGYSGETSVDIEFWVDNNTEEIKTLSSIGIGQIIDVTFNWVPTEERQYYLTVYAVPITGEKSTWDNIRSGVIVVNIISGMILVDDGHGTDANFDSYYSNIELMGPEKFRVHHTSSPITAELLAHYDVFISAVPTEPYTQPEVASLEQFVESGGGVLVIGEDDDNVYSDLTSYAGISWGNPYFFQYDGETSEINDHEITEDVDILYFGSPQLPLEVTSPAEELVYTFGGVVYNRVTVAASEYEQGKMVVIADTECLNNQFFARVDNPVFSENIIKWLSNAKPSSIINLPLNGTVYMHTDSIRFDGTSSFDPDGDTLNYLWRSDLTGFIGNSSSFQRTLPAGRHTISLEVSDPGGKLDLAVTKISVLSPPTAVIQFPIFDALLSGVVEISGTAADPDGTVLLVELEIDDMFKRTAVDTSTANDWSTWRLSWDTTEVLDGNYRIMVRALDDTGLNSSIEVVSVFVDNTAPSITSGPIVTFISDTGATITWQTDEPTTGTVEYGENTAYGSTVSNTSYSTSHKFVLTGLESNSVYHFRALSVDKAGNGPVMSSNMNFETELPPDFVPPTAEIKSPDDTDILIGTVTIEADVSDNYGIAMVEFYIEDELEHTDLTPDYKWLWNTESGNYPDDFYTIEIIAYDLSGNEARDEITVMLDNEVIHPLIDSARATPRSVLAGETTEILFTVQVADPEDRLESIVIDLSAINGQSNQRLYDDGTNGDDLAGDNKYTFKTTVAPDVLYGEKTMLVTLRYDPSMKIDTTITLEIISPGPAGDTGTITEETQDLTLIWLIIIIAAIAAASAFFGFTAMERKRSREEIEVVILDESEYDRRY
jgi:hypothetical protein